MRVTFAQTPGEEDRLSYAIWQKHAPGRGDSRAKIPKLGCTLYIAGQQGNHGDWERVS